MTEKYYNFLRNLTSDLSPLEAIRAKCRECTQSDSDYITNCPSHGLPDEPGLNCNLYPLRLGRSVENVRPLTQIKRFCLSCGEGTWQDVAACPFKEQKPDLSQYPQQGDYCSLYQFRRGRNPKRKGQGGKPPAEHYFKASVVGAESKESSQG